MENNTSTGLQSFVFNDFPIRTITNDKGEPYFVAQDVCKVLELSNVGQALTRLDDDEKDYIILNDGNKGNPNQAIINESGLYSLVLSSRKPEAKAFKKWVTSEVLPAIRKTGKYESKPMDTLDVMQLALNQLKEQREELKAIQETKQQSEAYMAQLQATPISAMQVDVRKAVDTLVKHYAQACNIRIDTCWTTLYQQFATRYHKNLHSNAKKERISPIV